MRRAGLFVALLVLAWVAWDTGADPVRLARGLPWIADFVRRMVPPDLAVLPAACKGALLTVEIALLGTAVAAVLALPLGFLSARNVAPTPIFYPARAVLNLFRSVDTLVYALIFVAAVGLGPFPGVLAVIAYTTTSLAKLYSEAIEGIEPGPVDAITATGATRLQILRFGVLPQVLPLLEEMGPKLLDSVRQHLRAQPEQRGRERIFVRERLRVCPVIQGLPEEPIECYTKDVSTGGIGFYLQTYLRMIDYPAASTALLVTIVMVMVVDALSSRLRARLV